MSGLDVVLTFYTEAAPGAVKTFDWPEGWPVPRAGENVFVAGEALTAYCLNWSPESGRVEVRCENIGARLGRSYG